LLHIPATPATVTVALESVILPPHAEGLVIGRLNGYKGEKLPGEVLVEPHELGTPGAYVDRGVSRVLTLAELRVTGATGRLS
jgi:hypothetical protein